MRIYIRQAFRYGLGWLTALPITLALLLAVLISVPELAMAQWSADGRNADPYSLEDAPAEAGDPEVLLLRATPFGRMVVRFPVEAAVSVDDLGGVVKLDFPAALPSEDMSIAIDGLADYIVAHRHNSEGTSYRLALAAGVRVLTQQLHKELYIDFLPPLWSGPPPGLPSDAIQEMVARARQMEQELEKVRQLLSLGRDKFRITPVPVLFPTFARIYFRWTSPVAVSVHRDNKLLRLVFDAKATSAVNSPLDGLDGSVLSFESRIVGADKTVIDLRITEDTDVRTFQAAEGYVVDIIGEAGALQSDALSRATAGNTVTDAQGAVTSISPPLVEQREAGDVPMVPEALLRGGERTINRGGQSGVPLGFDTLGPRSQIDQPSIVTASISEISDGTEAVAATIAGAPLLIERWARVDGRGNPPRVRLPAGGRADVTTGSLAAPSIFGGEGGNSSPAGNQEPMQLTAGVLADTAELRLPGAQDTPLAVFVRGLTLWMVVDTKREILMPAPIEDNKLWSGIKYANAGGRQVIRIALTAPLPVQARVEDGFWVIELGTSEKRTNFRDASVRRVFSGARAPLIRINTTLSGTAAWHEDGEFQDLIMVVTSLPPAHPVSQEHQLIDVTVLPSRVGIAVVPHADRLEVDFDTNGMRISHPDGMNLSLIESEAWQDAGKDKNVTELLNIDVGRQHKIGGVTLLEQLLAMERRINVLDYPERAQAEMEYGRRLLEYRLADEAYGALQVAISGYPRLASNREFIGLLGVSELLRGRPDEAYEVLSHNELEEDEYANLWRGLAAAQAGLWQDALGYLEAAEPLVRRFGEYMQVEYHLSLAEVALEVGELWLVKQQMDQYLKKKTLRERERYEVLSARYQQALGNMTLALREYDRISNTYNSPNAVRATFESIKLRLERDMFSRQEALDALGELMLISRGDRLEPKIFNLITQLMLSLGLYRDAFATGTTYVKKFPDHPAVVSAYEMLTDEYRDLFMLDKADEIDPLDALSIFYDYSELIPPGAEGDAMALKMANRLLENDLVFQSIAVMEHQVNERLSGFRRSETAAKLALIYLMNRETEKALSILSNTRQSEMPRALSAFRRVLEAKLLLELNMYERAEALLEGLDSEKAGRVRAQIYWKSGQWGAAAAQLEELAKPSDSGNIDQITRLSLARAAAGYALAGDLEALQALRSKFSGVTSDGGMEQIFATFSRVSDPQSVEFAELDGKLLALDDVDVFIDDMLQEFDAKFPLVLYDS